MNVKYRPLLAEFLGTALFVFIGAGSVVANAVTNAIGVRVSGLPFTPRRILDALAKK